MTVDTTIPGPRRESTREERALAGLEDRYEHEDLDPDERLELLDEIRALRRRLGR